MKRKHHYFMKALKWSLTEAREGRTSKRYILDTLLGIVAPLCVTAFIYLFHLYPAIPDISIIYLLAVLGLASTQGRYSAILASLIAFFSFDFFLVPPLYMFTIGKLEEWVALFIFLLTAVTTGQLAAALRGRAEQARQRENETRALYELLSATTREESLELQLAIVARAIVKNFAFAGIRNCTILLPGEDGKMSLHADAYPAAEPRQLMPDEEQTALAVMHEGKIVDLYTSSTSSGRLVEHWFRRAMSAKHPGRLYVRMFPLQMGQKVVGVMKLQMEDNPERFMLHREEGMEKFHINPQATFFWTFLDQATAVIERARLRRESLRIELLQRTDALRSALLSSVSHDLRTPLSSIKAAASSLLQEDVQWNEEERKSFALSIERESDRLNRLVGNLLDMTRIEGGALKPEKEWYPIYELIHDTLGHMQFLLQGHEVQTHIPDDLPPVGLDYLQMGQVLTNLLENAARYTPPTSPIEITAQVVDGEMMVSIADRGPGIPQFDLERVFDKFYRVLSTARKKKVTGSGLGLAVCLGLVEAHGGRIWAENRPDGGAVFRFTLPLEDAELEHGVA
jgi:two-component system, OmpR family, sensor histidine kinase KdpD